MVLQFGLLIFVPLDVIFEKIHISEKCTCNEFLMCVKYRLYENFMKFKPYEIYDLIPLQLHLTVSNKFEGIKKVYNDN